MPKIIISYRRADTDAIAGRIRDRLANYYGEDAIFMDIDNIPFGTDFRDHIRAALFDSDILLAVVGPKWLGLGRGASSRIKTDNDPIRIEVEIALQRNIPVIPVLVNGGRMPKPADLPESLGDFAFRNAAEVDSGRDFHPHMDRLIRSIDRVLRPSDESTAKSKPGSAAAAVTGGTAPVLPLPTPEAADAAIAPATENESVDAPAPVNANAAEPHATDRDAAPVAPAPGLAGEIRAGETPAAGRRGRSLVIPIAAGLIVLAAAIWIFHSYGPQPGVVETPQQPTPEQPTQVTEQTPAPPVRPAPVADATASCEGATFAFYDNFKTPDPGWDLSNQAETYYVNGQLVIRPEADTSLGLIYSPLQYQNAIVCLDVSSPDSMDAYDVGGGAVFWAADYQNYYVALVYADGTYRVSRKVHGTWVAVSPSTRSEFVKRGLAVVNRIRVATVGNVATLYVNDRKVQDIKGQPPSGGGSVGVFAESEKGQATEWRYLELAVVKLPETQPVPSVPPEAVTNALLETCKASAPAAFADDFKVPDPSWSGLTEDKAYYADGQIKIRANINRLWEVAYWGMIFKNATLCAEVKAPSEMKSPSDTAGGILFWATGNSNYYVAAVYPDGSYAISRRIEGWIEKISSKASSPGINKGPDARNQLKLVLTDDTATLFINGGKVTEFKSEPPSDGGSIGLFSESEANQRNEWSFLSIVVAAP